jgi:hypothetical protein
MTNTEELLETTTNRLANIKIEFPRLLDWESLQNEFATPNFTLDLGFSASLLFCSFFQTSLYWQTVLWL